MVRQAGHYIWTETPRHYFECAPPPLPEEMEWKTHFALPYLKCNQVGALWWDEEGYEIVVYRPSHKISHGYCQVQLSEKSMLFRPKDAEGKTKNKYTDVLDDYFYGRARTVSKAQLVWEIRNGIPLTKGRIIHKNYNTMDFREENLMIFAGNQMGQWRKGSINFINETVKQLRRREKRALDLGFEPLEYFDEVLKIPRIFLKAYEKSL